MSIELRFFVDLHFLYMISNCLWNVQQPTYHLEAVELLLDLLSEHRSQAITSSNLSTSVILPTRPRVVKPNLRTETYVTSQAPWSPRHALRTGICKPCDGHEVVITLDGDRVGTAMAMAQMILTRSTRSTGSGRLHMRDLGEAKVSILDICRSVQRQGTPRVISCMC